MEGVKFKIFGAEDCEKCKALMKAFEFHSISYVFVDANAKENEAICDKFNIDELPHIQAVYEDNDKPFLSHIGYISPLLFIDKVKKYSSEIKKFLDLNINVAKNKVNQDELIQKMKDGKQNGRPTCGSCSKKTKPK